MIQLVSRAPKWIFHIDFDGTIDFHLLGGTCLYAAPAAFTNFTLLWMLIYYLLCMSLDICQTIRICVCCRGRRRKCLSETQTMLNSSVACILYLPFVLVIKLHQGFAFAESPHIFSVKTSSLNSKFKETWVLGWKIILEMI